MRLVIVSIVLALTTATTMSAGPSDAAGAPPPGDPQQALFEGRHIDLAQGWNEARACAQLPSVTHCFRTVADMERELSDDFAVLACSSPLRLYDGTSFGGVVLTLTTTGTLLNLSTFGFDNRTSSYRVGACNARFFDTPGGSTQYPGTTTAGASAASMLSGWNNRLSSVRIG